jgi:hypothetical protein
MEVTREGGGIARFAALFAGDAPGRVVAEGESMLRVAALSSFASLALFALGCGGAAQTGSGGSIASTYEPLVSTATSLHFTTSSSLAGNPPPAVDVTVTSASVVRSIFAETIAQPVFQPGDYSCPADFGITYHLVFTSGAKTTTADLTPGGCSTIVLDGSTTTELTPSAQYWTDLANALGIVEATIFPYVPPTTS